MAVIINSYNQLLGQLVRKIIADTSLNDVNTGSTLLSLLEAVAQNDFENSASALNILELLNIDAISNSDLDARAADYGLTRFPAKQSTGFVTFGDSSITKLSTGFYQVKLPPIAGATQIFVNDASLWAPTGTLFIGRGTQNFEGPIPYTSIVNNTTFFTINLGAALQKDHLISDVIVNAQGTIDRLIVAGTLVQIPANNLNPAVQFVTLRNAIIPSGEVTISDIDIVSSLAGSRSNAGINTITSFVSNPFPTATVQNTTALTNGSDVESDDALRERIKSYAATLARGTKDAILASVIGVSDATDGNQVTTATITEPLQVGDPSLLYIDNGNGFQPTYAGQSVDVLLNNATGNEEFLQLSNYPLPRPQVINIATGPFQLANGMTLRVTVDGVEETITFSVSQFVNIASARVSEVIVAINSQSTLFKAAFTNNSNNILLFPVDFHAEIIQVLPFQANTDPLLYANNIIKFPTNKFSYIKLYQNNILLHEKQESAVLTTTEFSTWNITTSSPVTKTLSLSVDNTPIQTQSFTISDFGGSAFESLSLANWVTAINNKFAGITVVATSSGSMSFKSNKIGATSALTISGGTLFDNWFINLPVTSTGQDSNFQLNRQTGNLRILNKIAPGDSITAGISDAKGTDYSSATTSGTYNLSDDASNRVADMIIIPDSSVVARTGVSLVIGNTITISIPSSNIMRVMSSVATTFTSAQPGDFVFIVNKTSTPTWVDPASSGLYKIKTKGSHTSNGIDTYIDVANVNAVAGGPYSITATQDIQVFSASSYPQLWKSSFLSTPASATIQNVIDSINANLINVKSSIFKTNIVKLTSTTEDGGSIALPISMGNATFLYPTAENSQTGNPSHIANRVFSKDAVSFFKRTSPTSLNADNVSGKSVWLNRVTYTDEKGLLTSTAQPGVIGTDTYSELLQATGILTSSIVDYDDIYNALSGSNKGQYRSVRDKVAGDAIGTQYELPSTLMDYIPSEKFDLMRPISISSEDSLVFILDKNAVTNTIDIPMSRRGQVNSTFSATNFSFSANDVDNETGITFGTLPVWGKHITNTEFQNYAVWMRARNWYVSGGAGTAGGSFIVRSKEYGRHGENLRFKIEYPALPSKTNSISHINTPDYTIATYTFGSDVTRSSGTTAGDNFTVTSLGSYNYRYSFTGAINLSTVLTGDILSIQTSSGVSLSNSGVFSINAVNILGKTLDVYNPNGAITAVGSPEVTSVSTVADVIGSRTVNTITTNAISGTIADNSYFYLRDSAGIVAVVYDKNSSVGSASSYGANRIIVVTLTGSESNATLTALTAGVIAGDPEFTATFLGNVITVTNNEYGNIAVASDSIGGPTTFAFAGTAGNPSNSLNSKYFILRDSIGTVAFWYDTTGISPEPLHGANRAVRISTVISGDSANTVATKTAVVINNDAFSATALANVVTATDHLNGSRLSASAGTSGFVVAEVTPGANTVVETITNPSSFLIYPLLNTSVTDIVTAISTSPILIAAAISTTNPIKKATREEVYTPAGPSDYSASLAYGHNPDPTSSLNSYVSFYDGINWVKDFANTNPNFTLKTNMILQGAAPLAYSIITAPNSDSVNLGEFFKLVPVTLNNLKHHFTHKALSQLPILAQVDISSNIRKIQVKSQQLGSQGAVEVVGGNANAAEFSISGQSQIVPGISNNFLEVKTAAFPVTLTKGDVVKIENSQPAQRLSRLLNSDTVDVVKVSDTTVDYRFNSKVTNFDSSTLITITDISASYGRPSNTVWRWSHSVGSGSYTLANVVAGDMLNVYGTFSGWSTGNKSRMAGDGLISGLPIINVNAASRYMDIVNTRGVAMASTAIGTGNVKIFPTPFIKWNLQHAAIINISQIVVSGGTATVTTVTPHGLKESDAFTLNDNTVVPTSAVLTVPGTLSFTFTTSSSNGTYILGNIIKSTDSVTRYTIESLGFNSLYRLQWIDGNTPGFIDCGAAVDDILFMSGTTFSSNNNGAFRILGITNNSIIFENSQATEILNTYRNFNNLSNAVSWTNNYNQVVGTAGSFKNINIGDWVKAQDDSVTLFVQVTALLDNSNVPTTASLATKLLLGSSYQGVTSSSLGIAFNEIDDVGKGVYLQNVEDIYVMEGDSARIGDTLFVDSIVTSGWFNTANSGSFIISLIGNEDITFKPYLRVVNPSGISEANKTLGISLIGFFVLESDENKFVSYRVVNHTVIDSFNSNNRAVYLSPSTKSDKVSQTNGSKLVAAGKLLYSTDVTTGIDGYEYYTGLLRTVQRIVDGYEPNTLTYPGLRAVGGLIETLYPLIRSIKIAVQVTTKNGVNLNDISNDIKSAIITYVDALGVNQDVIMSEIIVAIMAITGVAAVTFTNPTPGTERISIAYNEHAFIEPSDITVA